ncbi:MAG: hypothetical protein LBE10_11170 [Treponema sp.]|nr:hypothetical protein [Treponema sp.]
MKKAAVRVSSGAFAEDAGVFSFGDSVLAIQDKGKRVEVQAHNNTWTPNLKGWVTAGSPPPPRPGALLPGTVPPSRGTGVDGEGFFSRSGTLLRQCRGKGSILPGSEYPFLQAGQVQE